MIISLILFVIFMIGVGYLSILAIKHGPIGQIYGAYFVAVVLLVTSYQSLEFILGEPKPIEVEWLRDLEEREIIAEFLMEDQGIYVWLNYEGYPKNYVLPWDEATAKQLMEARERAEGSGVPVLMSYKHSAGQFVFYEAPQPPLPDKERNIPDSML